MNDTYSQNPLTGAPVEQEKNPFVNEECGDTMWDAVLSEAEERLTKSLPKKSEAASTEKIYTGKEDLGNLI